MKYCTVCIMPNTRPDQSLDEKGVCNACLSYKNQEKIDWKERKQKLNEIIEEKKLQNKNGWNCVVPGSGGKDSTYQIIRAKELGLNPVFVTASTCDLSDIGRYNLENIKKIGFDVVEISNNSKRCSLDLGNPILSLPLWCALKNGAALTFSGASEISLTSINSASMRSFNISIAARQ